MQAESSPNKLPPLSETRLSLALAENGTFRWDRGGLARASDADCGELAGSSGRPVGPPAPFFPPRQLGTVGVTGCDCWPVQSRGELRLAAFHSLTRSSVFTSPQM